MPPCCHDRPCGWTGLTRSILGMLVKRALRVDSWRRFLRPNFRSSKSTRLGKIGAVIKWLRIRAQYLAVMTSGNPSTASFWNQGIPSLCFQAVHRWKSCRETIFKKTKTKVRGLPKLNVVLDNIVIYKLSKFHGDPMIRI